MLPGFGQGEAYGRRGLSSQAVLTEAWVGRRREGGDPRGGAAGERPGGGEKGD